MRSFGFCFGIVWCWRSTSCFRLLASLPYMSIIVGHEIDDITEKVYTHRTIEQLQEEMMKIKNRVEKND